MLAVVDELLRDDAVRRRQHPSITERRAGRPHVRLRGREAGSRRGDGLLGSFVIPFGDRPRLEQLRRLLEVPLCRCQIRLRGDAIGFGARRSAFLLGRFEARQHLSRAHAFSFPHVDTHQIALESRADFDRFDWVEIAGDRDAFLDRVAAHGRDIRCGECDRRSDATLRA